MSGLGQSCRDGYILVEDIRKRKCSTIQLVYKDEFYRILHEDDVYVFGKLNIQIHINCTLLTTILLYRARRIFRWCLYQIPLEDYNDSKNVIASILDANRPFFNVDYSILETIAKVIEKRYASVSNKMPFLYFVYRCMWTHILQSAESDLIMIALQFFPFDANIINGGLLLLSIPPMLVTSRHDSRDKEHRCIEDGTLIHLLNLGRQKGIIFGPKDAELRDALKRRSEITPITKDLINALRSY